MAGNSNGRCVTWGYLLGQRALGRRRLKAEILPKVKTEEELAAEQKAADRPPPRKRPSRRLWPAPPSTTAPTTGAGRGIGGDVPVTVTIEGGDITAVEVGDNAETQGIGSNAIEQLPAKIVEANGTNGVEASRGASVTSNAIFAAVNDGLTQASA